MVKRYARLLVAEEEIKRMKQIISVVRTQVDEAAQLDTANRSLTDDLMFWRTPDPPGTPVDARRESQRLRENAALAAPRPFLLLVGADKEPKLLSMLADMSMKVETARAVRTDPPRPGLYALDPASVSVPGPVFSTPPQAKRW